MLLLYQSRKMYLKQYIFLFCFYDICRCLRLFLLFWITTPVFHQPTSLRSFPTPKLTAGHPKKPGYKCLCDNDRVISKEVPHYMMTSWNGNIFCFTGSSRGKLSGHRWIPLTKASDTELWCLCRKPGQTIEQTVELLVISDAMIFMWRHCNDHTTLSLLFWLNTYNQRMGFLPDT